MRGTNGLPSEPRLGNWTREWNTESRASSEAEAWEPDSGIDLGNGP
jgi:hypothetical protein